MLKWVRITLMLLTVEGALLLVVAYLLLWKPEFMELHHVASGVVCAMSGIGLLAPAAIGMMSGILSRAEMLHKK